jgi:hypothetical protein
MQRFRRFQILTASGGQDAGQAAVASELGDSYFYYFFYTSRKQP